MRQLGNLVRSVNAAKEGEVKRIAGVLCDDGMYFGGKEFSISPITPDDSPEGSIVSILIDADAIVALAEQVAAWKDPLDVYIWLWAEAELQLENAYFVSKCYHMTSLNDNPGQIIVDVSRVVDTPREDRVRELAGNISSKKPTLMEAHWYLAERLYIYNKVKALDQA
ncbi:hypothetical protein GF325_13100 [Candidatus Bathyarchaeota archaeon]|nr:hypothetical protein [Candidatus Bathyarchaeota archaeon]